MAAARPRCGRPAIAVVGLRFHHWLQPAHLHPGPCSGAEARVSDLDPAGKSDRMGRSPGRLARPDRERVVVPGAGRHLAQHLGTVGGGGVLGKVDPGSWSGCIRADRSHLAGSAADHPAQDEREVDAGYTVNGWARYLQQSAANCFKRILIGGVRDRGLDDQSEYGFNERARGQGGARCWGLRNRRRWGGVVGSIR